MIGIDEVGRGAWAGPLLIVAVRPKITLPVGLADSKKLTRMQREVLLPHIIKLCDVGEGWVSAVEIDNQGLAESMKSGVGRALKAISALHSEEIILDGPVNYVATEYRNAKVVVKADEKIPEVSAASIYAKVTRDRYMSQSSMQYLDFHFETNVGYGTPEHKAALWEHGPIIGVHRFSFKPIVLVFSR